MKKFLSFVLSLVMLFSVIGSVSTTAIAGYDTSVTAKNIQFGYTYKGTIDEDVWGGNYKFSLTSASTVKITFNSSVQGSVKLTLYNADKEELVTDDAYLSFSRSYALTKGTYYLEIYQPFDDYGDYSFKLSSSSSNESFPEAEGGSDNYTKVANVIELGKTYKGQIALNDWRDMYKLNVSSDSKVKISFSSSFEGQAKIKLYDSDGWILEEDDAYWSGVTGEMNFSRTYDLTQGTYYLEVSTPFDEYGDYTFNVSLVLPAPKLLSVLNTASGVKITWGEVNGADNYNVYRKTYNATTKKWSRWSRIKKGTTSTSYTDTAVKSGVYYRYTIIANNEAGSSKYDTTGLKTYFLSTPKLTSIANNTGKVTVKWGKVSGATGYFVYRRTYNATTKTWGGWTRIAKTKSNAYNDATAKSGVYYRYTVRAYYSSYTSYFDTTGLQTKFLATPTLKAATSTKAGVKVTWSKVSGAKGYDVYRRTYSGGEWSGWSKIATTKSGSTVAVTDKTAKKGVTYRYTVRAKSDSYRSYYNTKGLQIKDKY